MTDTLRNFAIEIKSILRSHLNSLDTICTQKDMSFQEESSNILIETTNSCVLGVKNKKVVSFFDAEAIILQIEVEVFSGFEVIGVFPAKYMLK